MALVIGNSAYRSVPALANPRNDAHDIAAALVRLGFETSIALDSDRDQMERAIETFSAHVNKADVALFYFAGHGIQHQGVNYLIPTDAEIRSEASLRRLIKLNDVVADVRRAKALRILVLDACRDNPFGDALADTDAGKSRSVGLAKLQRTSSQAGSEPDAVMRGGDIVVYAAEAGSTAADGEGRNSPFASAILRNIEVEGQEIVSLVRRVASSVQQATAGAQRPELLLSVPFEFYFKAGAPQPPPTIQQLLPTARSHEVESIEAQIRATVGTVPIADRGQVTRELTALLSDMASRSNLRPDQIANELPKAFSRLLQMRGEIAQFRSLMENEPEIAPFVEIAAAAVASGRKPDLKAADEALAQAQARYDSTVRARQGALTRARSNRAALSEQRGHIAETEARSKEAAALYLAAATDTPEEDLETAARRFAMAGAALFVEGTNFFANDILRDAIRLLEVEALTRFERATVAEDRKPALAASSALVLAQIADAQTVLGSRLPGIDGARMMVDARATYGNALKRIQVSEFPGIAMDILDRRSQRDLQFGRRITKDRGRGHFAEAVKTMRLVLSIQQGKPAFADQLSRTRNNLANALKELSLRTEGEEGDRLIDEAAALFEASAEALSAQRDDRAFLIAQLNLGHALAVRGARKPALVGIADIERAQGVFAAVGEALKQKKNPRLQVLLDQYRAELARTLGQRRTDKTRALEDLRTAFETYQGALTLVSKETAPNDWAMLCAEMGHTLVAALPQLNDASRGSTAQNAVSLFETARPYLVAGGFGQDLDRLSDAIIVARGALP